MQAEADVGGLYGDRHVQALRAAHGKKEGGKKKRKRGDAEDEEASSVDETSDASDDAVGTQLSSRPSTSYN